MLLQEKENKLKKSKQKWFKKAVVLTLVLSISIPTLSFDNSAVAQNVQRSESNRSLSSEHIQTWMVDHTLITRAEFMSLINYTFGYTKGKEVNYKDTSKSDEYYQAISIASEYGYMNGYEDHTIRPNDYVTRQEAAKVISIIKKVDANVNNSNYFSDSSSISQWSKGYVGGVAAANLMSGDAENLFNPLTQLTRADAVALVNTALKTDVSTIVYPLPAVKYGENAAHSQLKRIAATNPFIKILDGFDQIWSLNQPEWRTGTALTTPGVNGEVANYDDGPLNYYDGYKNNTQAVIADQKTFENVEIRNKAVWVANIKYVEDVTQNRTDEEALAAYYDDQRDKIYSMMDAFGPLANTYVEIVNPVTNVVRTVEEMNIVLEEETVEDQSQGIGLGDAWKESELADMIDLVSLIRFRTPASSNPAKYFFSSPRPWRMNSNGEVIEIVDENGLAVWETMGSGEATSEKLASGGNKTTGEKHIQKYETNVELIPALKYVRRKAEDGYGKDGAFPSGHTSAAYLSTFGFAYATPERYSQFLTRAAQMGENRIVTGMHSPLDVIGARIQATAMTAYALNKPENQEVVKKAYENAGEVFSEKAAANNMSLYEYANTVTEDYTFESAYDEKKWEDHEANKAFYREKLTYGLPQTGIKGLEPKVPEGAEVLLETRQPYLTDEQRRDVLYTTSLESGYALLDESNGWGTIDLVTAADGYGSFNKDVIVTMEASKGRFNAEDWWRNDIDGVGKLTKAGTGKLTLTGENSYTGGTILQNGTLVAQSTTAFGKGDFVIENGTAIIDVDGELNVSSMTMQAGVLSLVIDGENSQIKVDGTLNLQGGELQLDLSKYDIKGSTQITLIESDVINGKFNTVVADGYSVNLSYENNRIIATVQAN